MALEIHAYGFICGILGCCIGTLVGRYLPSKSDIYKISAMAIK